MQSLSCITVNVPQHTTWVGRTELGGYATPVQMYVRGCADLGSTYLSWVPQGCAGFRVWGLFRNITGPCRIIQNPSERKNYREPSLWSRNPIRDLTILIGFHRGYSDDRPSESVKFLVNHFWQFCAVGVGSGMFLGTLLGSGDAAGVHSG